MRLDCWLLRQIKNWKKIMPMKSDLSILMINKDGKLNSNLTYGTGILLD